MPTANEDIIDALLGQHQQITLLFGQVGAADGPAKQELFAQLVALLAVHESVEESLVHPLAERRLDDGDAIVEPRLAEEQEAKQALSRLYDLGVDDPRFNDELVALRDAVAAHAEAEERLEFAPLREAVDPERLRQLTAAMRAAAALAPTRPHPQVPPNPAANLLIGTPLAVFDKARDALRDAVQAAS